MTWDCNMRLIQQRIQRNKSSREKTRREYDMTYSETGYFYKVLKSKQRTRGFNAPPNWYVITCSPFAYSYIKFHVV